MRGAIFPRFPPSLFHNERHGLPPSEQVFGSSRPRTVQGPSKDRDMASEDSPRSHSSEICITSKGSTADPDADGLDSN